MKYWMLAKNLAVFFNKANSVSIPNPALILSERRILLMTQLSKIILVSAIALFLTLAVFNQVIHYATHFVFLQHIISMDAIFLDYQSSWRAITLPVLQHTLYWLFIFWEMIAAILCWWAVYWGWRAYQQNTLAFHQAKALAMSGLSLAMLIWLIVFSVGSEWFLMWQSDLWNGQDTAFRIFTMIGMVLIVVSFPENNKCYDNT